MFSYIQKLISGALEGAGMSEASASDFGQFGSLLLIILISYLAYKIGLKIIRQILLPIFRKSKNQFDDILVNYKFFRRLSFFIPLLVVYIFIEETLVDYPLVVNAVKSIVETSFIILFVLILDSLLSTTNDFYDRFEVSKDRPIKGIIQVIKIVIYIFGLLAVVGSLFNTEITSILLSLGTLSAVLMLIFRDPILGFVGGLQLVFNKMVRIGDWVSMPKFGADGTVLEISLTTVKVQNWDMTIITIPTYSLISGSFQNWRGMEESGGRRIKRSVNLNMESVKFCTSEMLDKFRKISVITDYIDTTEQKVVAHNEKSGIDPSILVNGRRQTNLGVFRAYLKAYLRNRSDIHSNMTFLVRHLQPTEKGLPIEIYVFTKTTAWADYEGIQADIFDHILAVIPEFELQVYQFPANSDLKQLN